jgi:NAD+ diphosphatase
MQRRNVFAGPYLDRAAHLRSDETWFSNALKDQTSRVVAVWNSRNLVSEAAPRAAFLTLDKIPAEQRNLSSLILLGCADGINFFAYEFESIDPPQFGSDTRFEDLRLVASLLPANDAGILAYARALVSWRRRHRFCGSCGYPTLPARGGHVLVCTNASCRHEQFPRLDPAIIVLITDGERALLGRQATWPLGRYSTIAGFVEPGESLEDAVVREVLEETGVLVDNIEYHSSQPWPFPSSLMIGFSARAVTHEIERRDDELEDARWFSREEVAAGTPVLPPQQSISFSLIEHWFNKGSPVPLHQSQGSVPWPNTR